MATRRSPNTGSIVRKGEAWQACADLGRDRHGHKIGRYKTLRTRREAEKWLARYESGRARKATFAAYALEWLAYKKQTVGVETFAAYESIVLRHLTPRLGALEMNAIRPRAIERILIPASPHDARIVSQRNYQKGRYIPIGPPMFAKMRTVLHNLFNRALRDEVVSSNPVLAVTLPGSRSLPKQKGRNQKAMEALLAASVGEPGEVYMTLALGCAARPSELLALRYCDIDFDENTVLIGAAMGRLVKNGPRVRKPLKTAGRGIRERTVPVDPAVLDPIRGRSGDPEAFIFATASGLAADIPFAEKAWLTPIFEKSRIGGRFTPYSTRHTYTTVAAKNGIPASTLAYILGHTTTKMVLDVYTSVTPDMAFDAAKTMGKVFNKPRAVTPTART